MSTHSTTLPARPAWRTRGGLALLCGLLGLPGSTIAWDLPLGGYWIGMPLAACAIALGWVAQRSGDRPERRLAAGGIALGVAEVLFTASWTLFG